MHGNMSWVSRTRGLVWAMAIVAQVLGASVASARVVDIATGLSFPSRTKVDDVSFRCLGAGVRKAFFLDVYSVAFCLEEATARRLKAQRLTGDRAISALGEVEGDKLVVLRLVRSVTSAEMANAFRKTLAAVLSEDQIAQLTAAIPGDARAGQTVRLFSKGDTLVLDIAGRRAAVTDADIVGALWQTWLGPNSVTPALKKSIIARHFPG